MDDFLYLYFIFLVVFIVIVSYLKFKPIEFKLHSSVLEMPHGFYCLKKTMFVEMTYANIPFAISEEDICDGQIIPQEGFWKKGIQNGTPLYFVNRSDFETKTEISFKYHPFSGKFVVSNKGD